MKKAIVNLAVGLVSCIGLLTLSPSASAMNTASQCEKKTLPIGTLCAAHSNKADWCGCCVSNGFMNVHGQSRCAPHKR